MKARLIFISFISLLLACNNNVPKKTKANRQWESVAGGLSGHAYNMAIYKDELYVCGDFGKAGDANSDLIARWNGNRWAALGNGVKPINDDDMDLSIIAMQVFNGKLWVSGTFDSADNIPSHSVACWDGTKWDTIGGGLKSLINVFAVYNGKLIAGGYFDSGYGKPMNHIVQWSGSRWEALGEGVNDYIFSLCVYKGKLYVGGRFTKAGNIPVNSIACWDGSTWQDVGQGVNNVIDNMWVFGDKLYVSGDFTKAGELHADSLTSWDGEKWAVEPAFKDVCGMTEEAPARFALKCTNEGNDKYPETILRQNGAVWDTIITATNINQMAYYKGYLYGAGTFDSIGKVKAANIVRCKIDTLQVSSR